MRLVTLPNVSRTPRQFSWQQLFFSPAYLKSEWKKTKTDENQDNKTTDDTIINKYPTHQFLLFELQQ